MDIGIETEDSHSSFFCKKKNITQAHRGSPIFTDCSCLLFYSLYSDIREAAEILEKQITLNDSVDFGLEFYIEGNYLLS